MHIEFIECLGQKYRKSALVDAAWQEGTSEKWQAAGQLGRECFESVQQFGQDSQQRTLCSMGDAQKRKDLFRSIIIGNGAAKHLKDPQGRDVVEYCLKVQ